MSHEMVWEPQGVLIRCWGTLTDDDLLRSNAEIYADPRFGASIRYQLMDGLSVEALDLRTETVRECARTDREISKRYPDLVIALVAKPGVLYGLSRLYAMQLEPSPWATEVFEDLAAARAWLKTKC